MGKATIYLKDEDERFVRKLARRYGSRSEVIRAGLAVLRDRETFELLAEKYRLEKEIPDGIARIQDETASDLGEYPW